MGRVVSVGAAVLLARMALTAAIVVAASWAAERSGPFLGAMVATLPISAGPAYVFLAMDHGPDFVAAGAVTSLAAVGATAAFVWAHALVSARAAMPLALAVAFAAWWAYLAAISPIAWSPAGAAALSISATLVVIVATRAVRRRSIPVLPAARPWHLVVRAVFVMGLVAAVTFIGEALGPKAAGMASVVPVVFTSFVVLLQPRIGGPATAAIMSHGLAGMLGFVPALAWLYLAAVPLGIWAALAGALAICVAWNGALVLVRGRLRGAG